MRYNKIYCLALFILINAYAYAQVTLNFSISYPAPSYLSDWSYTKSGVSTLVLMDRYQLAKVKFQTQLQTIDGTIIASSNNATAAVYSVKTGANVFSLDKLLQPDNLVFKDANVLREIQTKGKLPAGNYQLCVQVMGSLNGSTREVELLKAPSCRPFTQVSYQLPYLLAPNDKVWLDAGTAQSVITFRWSPVVPRTSERTVYRLQVFQVMDQQKAVQALRSNMPVLNAEIINSTQYIWRPQLNFKLSEKTMLIWTIQTLDSKGNPLITSDGMNLGWSEPRVFGVTANASLLKETFMDNSLFE